MDLIEITTGEYVSKANILKSSENIKSRLSEEGYAFARINPVPKKSDENESEVDNYNHDLNKLYQFF